MSLSVSMTFSVYKLPIPVMNAFCSCPLSPVFQGLMLFAPCLLQMKSTATKRVRKKAKLGITETYFQFIPEEPPEGFPFGTLGEPFDAAGYRFTTAGKDPLLRVTGAVSSGVAPIPGAARRFLDSSRSLRRTICDT